MLTNDKAGNNQSQLQKLNPENLQKLSPMSQTLNQLNLTSKITIDLINSFYRYNPNSNKWEKYDANSQSWNDVSKMLKSKIMQLQHSVSEQYHLLSIKPLSKRKLEEIELKIDLAQRFILKSFANTDVSSSIYQGLSLSLFNEEVLRLYQEFPESFIEDFDIL